jgi:hypothetical protein
LVSYKLQLRQQLGIFFSFIIEGKWLKIVVGMLEANFSIQPRPKQV